MCGGRGIGVTVWSREREEIDCLHVCDLVPTLSVVCVCGGRGMGVTVWSREREEIDCLHDCVTLFPL